MLLMLLRLLMLRLLAVSREGGTDGGGEQCSNPAVSQVFGKPDVPILAPAGAPAVLDIPELSLVVLNYFNVRLFRTLKKSF